MKFLLTILLLALALPVSAETYAVVCIVNSSDSPKTATYEFRWGEGEWKTYQLQPGKRYIHSWRLDPGESDPKASIKYDEMMDSGEMNPVGEPIQPHFIDEALTTKRMEGKISKGSPQYWFSLSEDGGDFSFWAFRRSD